MNSMPDSSSSARTAVETSPPNTASGTRSGVTSVTVNRIPESNARAALNSASSYSGSGHAMRPGETNATLRR